MAQESVVYTCVKKCFYRDRLWTPGEKLKVVSGTTVPAHFKSGEVKIEKPVEKEGPRTLSGVQVAEADAVKKGPLSFLD